VGCVIEAGITECRSGCILSGWLFDTDFVEFFNTSSQNSDEYFSQGQTLTTTAHFFH
jgi:hypothetical protein